MTRWVRSFGLLLGLAATAAFSVYAVRTLQGQDLSQYVSTAALVGIVIAALAYSLIIPLSALAWRRLLRDMDTDKSWGELSIIMSVTQLAKYIPGNIGQHVGRAAMSIGRGIPVRPYGISVVTEAVLAVVAATLTGVLGCGLSGTGIDILRQHLAIGLPAAFILAGVLVLALILCRRMLPSLLNRLTSKRVGETTHNVLPGNNSLAYALITYIFNYIVFGIGITVMVLLLLPDQHPQWLLLTGSFALAWVVGFFAPGAPAGLGVREGLMLAMLQFSYNRPDALLIVIALRLATTVGDILCFLVGFAALLFTDKHSPAHTTDQPMSTDHET